MPRFIALLLLTLTHCYTVVSIPQMHHVKRSLADSKHVSQTIIKHDTEKIVSIPLHNVVVDSARKQKAAMPISISSYQHPHQLIVPNLHVIPISNVHQIHGNAHRDVPTVISHTVSHGSPNITHQLVPVLIPIHNHLVPVHDLTVIPLHSVVHENTKIGFKITDRHPDESINNYRNPLGGYGAGWYFGGHGAGHGFHYSYG